MSTYRRFVFVLIPGVLMVAGCGNNEAVTFNNAIANSTKKLETTLKPFGDLIAKEKDPARLQAAHVDMIAKVKGVIAESNTIKVPAGQEAKNYWNALQTYFKNQEKMVTEDFKEVIVAMSSPSPNVARLQELTGRMEQIEKSDLAGLRTAQSAYAKANGMALK